MMPKLVIFDLDGTLAESKQPLTDHMAVLLSQLLAHTRVAIISGGALPQFLKQVVEQLPGDAHLSNLYLLPTSGAAFYEWKQNNWNKVYEERLSEKEAHDIEAAMRAAAAETKLIDFSKSVWGERIEYRGGQVTLSALGQKAPIEEKKKWDPDHTKRHMLQELLIALLPKFLVSVGGITSIDVTKRGIDKAYGVRKLCERFGISESEALYVGDELRAGGNDEVVYNTKVETKSVRDPAETKAFIESLISSI